MKKGRPAISLAFSRRFYSSCRNLPPKAFGSPATLLVARTSQQYYFPRPQQHPVHIAFSDLTDTYTGKNQPFDLPVTKRPASTPDRQHSQRVPLNPRRCQARQKIPARFEHERISQKFGEPERNPTGSPRTERASYSLQHTKMDPSQPWNWRQRGQGQGQGEHTPPIPNVPNPFGMPFSMPPNFNTGWMQPTFQNPFSQPGFPQPGEPQQQNDGRAWAYATFGLAALPRPFSQGPLQQNDGRGQGHAPFGRAEDQRHFSQSNQARPQSDRRGRGQAQPSQPPSWGPSRTGQPRQRDSARRQGEGDFYRPSPQFAAPQTNQENRQYGGEARGDGEDHPSRRRERQRNRRRATAPVWNFPENPPLPFPMDSPATGPFRSTRPVRQQNNQLTTGGGNPASLPPRPDTNTKVKKKKGGPPPYVARANANKSLQRSPPSATEIRDTISAPSAASGGIPEPTAEYLQRASFMTYRLTTPQPMLVVIDLNGTLLFRPNKRQASAFVERPLARAFLQRCIDRHHVVIWSSARPDNVRRMCAQLLPPAYLARVVAVWGRDRFGLSPDDYNRRTQCYKRLTRLWEDPVVAASHPLAAARSPGSAEGEGEGSDTEGLGPGESVGGGSGSGVWSQANTVLIDDSAEKARSEPHNAVTLPEFAGDLKETPQVLPLVEEYLDALSFQGDISTYIKVRPFKMGEGQPVAVVQESS
ncbi:uncharacterized protein B0H64DRAFT_431060 [Chaetomium fimeti]|uniref:FCP1 homology domain-containing protein n=1 Tax=Chaetomium fimeti TaxID=1854472 RepID=A0AAE0HIG6_9PEZI|nr:hypothetical protein B0H64DRAFT_431060 [Chaetomium fimeti]